MPTKITSPSDPRVQAYVGKKFNRLTAVRFVRINHRGQVWEFRCECGDVSIKALDTVKNGKAKSCGCLQKEAASGARKTHGFTSNGKIHPMYGVWADMVQRCTNPNREFWRIYGGRGIMVCERWTKFDNFKEDMFATYRHGLTLERKDNNGHYCKENCIWATKREQCLNQRRARIIEFGGQKLNLCLWASKIGIGQGTLAYRIKRWGVERAITTPKLK